MQEIRNNCFGSKKRNTTIRHSKVGKHECLINYNNVQQLRFLARVLTLFSRNEESSYFRSTRNNCCDHLVHTIYKGIFVNVQIFNFWFLADLHVFGTEEAKKQKISIVSGSSLVC